MTPSLHVTWGCRGRTSLKARVLGVAAVIIFTVYGVPVIEARNKVVEKYACEEEIASPTEFCQRHHAKWQGGKPLDDSPRLGRPHKIQEELAREMAELLLEGHTENGVKRYFHSVYDACCHNPMMAALVEASGVLDPEDVLPRVMQVCPDLVVRKQEVKMELPTEVKIERHNAAEEMAKLSWKYLMQVVWVDEMAMELKLPTSRNVLCRKGEEIYPAEEDVCVCVC